MELNKIIIGSDHAGFELKEYLKAKLEEKYDLIDVGTHNKESCHYPLFAKKVCESVLKENCFGILICGTGIGMSIMANRFNKIRAALCTTNFMAQMAREHNNANVLCIGARVLDNEKSKSIVNIFLNTEFDKENPRHKIRVDMFD